MKVAVLGGGFAGLAAAYDLRKADHEVVLFERASQLGGLASGFKDTGWDWPLERAYHHIFANDIDIINFAKDTGFDKIFFQTPITASLFREKGKGERGKSSSEFVTFPFDNPADLLKFPLISVLERIRVGAALAFLKYTPFLKMYERETAERFLRKSMGNHAWKVLWEQLLRKKFGKYAGKILLAFFWARITKRTQALGYMVGGFQSLIDHVARVNKDLGVEIRLSTAVEQIEEQAMGFSVSSHNEAGESVIEKFDAVISTLPTPVLAKVGERLFPPAYIDKIKGVEYLNALCLIVATKEPILTDAYWLNICTDELPLMVVCQHTNFIDKKHYNGQNIAYIGYYLESDDKLMQMTQAELVAYLQPYLSIVAKGNVKITKSFLFKAPFAQPLFTKEFLQHKPDFTTPIKNFFVANLDMTYPYDRGTNYAVKLGREVAKKYEALLALEAIGK